MPAGLIDQYREAIQTDPDRSWLQQDRVIAEIMKGETKALRQDEFVGSVDTALVHYFGDDAFGNNVLTDPYMGIVAKVYDRGVVGAEGQNDNIAPTPVLIVNRHESSSMSSLVHVDAQGGVKFRSSRNAETGHSELVLVGPTTVTEGDIVEDMSIGKVDSDDGLLLNETNKDYFDHRSTVVVGWREIEATLAGMLSYATTLRGLSDATRLRKFFAVDGQIPPADQASRLAALIEFATKHESSIGRLASHETKVVDPPNAR